MLAKCLQLWILKMKQMEMMNKYTPDYSTKFRRYRRLLMKRGYDMTKLENTIVLLLKGDIMPPEYYDNPLKGNYSSKIPYLTSSLEFSQICIFTQEKSKLFCQYKTYHQ